MNINKFEQHRILKSYDETEDNALIHRLNYIDSVLYKDVKFWDINHKAWVDCDSLINYKIQKELLINDELIFYIYLEDYNAEDWE